MNDIVLEDKLLGKNELNSENPEIPYIGQNFCNS